MTNHRKHQHNCRPQMLFSDNKNNRLQSSNTLSSRSSRRTTMTSFVAFLALVISRGDAFQLHQPQPWLYQHRHHHHHHHHQYLQVQSVQQQQHHHHPSTQLSARPTNHRRKSNTATYYSNSADPPFDSNKDVKSFGDRMRKLVLKEQQIERQQRHAGADNNSNSNNKSKINPRKPSFVREVVSLAEYKKVVADEKERLVVVRFYAKWCRACLAAEPYFYRLAQSMPDIKFVEVPVLEENANLHQGLGVPSLPFAHIYHPNVGLIEELKMSKKEFKNFQNVVTMYRDGQCSELEIDTETGLYVPAF